MRALISLFFFILVIESCCFHSECNCSSYHYVVDNQVKSWFNGADTTKNILIFKNPNNQRDTFAFTRNSGTMSCGAECVSTCDFISWNMTSWTNLSLKLDLVGEGSEFKSNMNVSSEEKNLVGFIYNTKTNTSYRSDTNIVVQLDKSYIWNNDTLTVLKINCKSASCSKYWMNNIVFSKEKGLIEFEDKAAVKWTKEE